MDRKIEKLLYKEFDGHLMDSEKIELNEAIKQDPDILEEKETLLKLCNLVNVSRVDSFKPFFETRVLNRINNSNNELSFPDLFTEVLMRQFRKILVPAMILILIIVSYNLSTADAISFDSAIGVPDVSLADTVDPINYLVVE